MGPELNRIAPLGTPDKYKSYTMAQPLATHWRPATCAEVDCLNFVNGWRTTVDESTELGQKQAHYIRHDPTRNAAETRTEPGLTEFTFSPGQTCFRVADHRLPVGREPLFLVTGGDWRGNPRGERRVHATAEDWVDDFATHQNTIADAIRRG